MALIDEKTRLPLGLVITALMAAIGLSAAAAVAQFRIGESAIRIDKVETVEHAHDVHLGEHHEMIRSMQDTINRIDRNVEEMRKQ